MTWKEVINDALKHLGGEAHLSEIYNYVKVHSKKPLTKTWKASIRHALEVASSDSTVFDGGEDVYYSAKGLGAGIWGLRNYEPTSQNMDLTQDDAGFSEGRENLALHIRRERNHQVITLAKQQKLNEEGKLCCQVCGFDFEITYGEVGKNFIEAHHIKPVSQLEPNEKTKIEDILLLCSNCHSMIHRRKPWLTIEQLSTLLVRK